MYRSFFVFLMLTSLLLACQPDAQQASQSTSEGEAPPNTSKQTPDADLKEANKYLTRMDELVATEDYDNALVEAQQASYHLQKVIAIDPNYSTALAGDFGRAYYYQNNFRKATEWYAQAAESDPSNAIFHRMEGMAHFNLGDIEAAQERVARSISVGENATNRAAIISEMMRIGITSFDYGTAYIEDGYPSKGKDYQTYGLAMYRMAHEFGGAREQELIKQIVAWGTYLDDSLVLATYKPLLK